MTHRAYRFTVFGLVLAATLAAAAENTRPSIERLSWMSGCWENAGEGPRIDEQWMTPRGGLMLGMARTVKDGRATQFEQMRIGEQEGSLVFTSKPSRQPEASFTAIEVSATRVVFENKTHDFPQRIIYRLNDDGTLAARIEGEQGGKTSGFDFPMRRATCARN